MPTYITVRRVRGPAWNAALPMRAQTLWAEHAAFMNALATEGRSIAPAVSSGRSQATGRDRPPHKGARRR